MQILKYVGGMAEHLINCTLAIQVQVKLAPLTVTREVFLAEFGVATFAKSIIWA